MGVSLPHSVRKCTPIIRTIRVILRVAKVCLNKASKHLVCQAKCLDSMECPDNLCLVNPTQAHPLVKVSVGQDMVVYLANRLVCQDKHQEASHTTLPQEWPVHPWVCPISHT